MDKIHKPSEKQIEVIKKLDEFIVEVWNTETTEERVKIAKKAIELTSTVQPATYISASGTIIIDEKGKSLITDTLKSDIQRLENKTYSTQDHEKFAIVSSLQILIGVFAHISAEDLIKVLRK